MLAVIKTGGKQYLVTPGQTIQIEKIEGAQGKKIEFPEVLLVHKANKTMIGTPFVSGVKVTATILEQTKGKKTIVFKYKPKKRYRKKTGHRQQYTKVKIENIIS